MGRYFVAGAIFLILCTPLRGAQSVQQRLQTKVKSYKLSEPNFASALTTVASWFKIPVGAELVASPSVLRPVNLSWSHTTALEVFTGLVHSQSGYRLRVDDGIVHVFQKDLVDQQSNFLNIRIARFQVQNVGATGAGQKLWRIVNARFQPPNPPGPGGVIGSGLGRFGDQTFSLHLRNATVRQILGAIAMSSNYPIWVEAFAPGKALTSTGFRRTVSPASGKAGPDSGQPRVELLRWGEQPY